MTLFLLLQRDWQLFLTRGGATLWYTLGFFVVTSMLFPFTLGTDSALLRTIAPAVLWVNALLAALLPVANLMTRDHELGIIEQYHLHGVTPLTYSSAKCIFHWLTTGLPLIAMIPVVGLLFGVEAVVLSNIVQSLVPGTLAFSVLGTMAAALTLGARRAEMLVPLLILPLAVPVAIFGAAAAQATNPHALALVWGVLLFLVPLGLGASVLAVRK